MLGRLQNDVERLCRFDETPVFDNVRVLDSVSNEGERIENLNES